jgi:hypothetical protein
MLDQNHEEDFGREVRYLALLKFLQHSNITELIAATPYALHI